MVMPRRKPGQGLDQCGLTVVDVSGGADDDGFHSESSLQNLFLRCGNGPEYTLSGGMQNIVYFRDGPW